MKRDITALIAFIDSRQDVPYAWGRHKNDCVGFVLGAIEAQTGKKFLRSYRWEGRKAALRLIKKHGGLEAAFDAHFDRIPPAQAMRGDIAGVPDKAFGIHPMIVEGVTLVAPGEGGNRRLKREAMTIAWSIVPKETP